MFIPAQRRSMHSTSKFYDCLIPHSITGAGRLIAQDFLKKVAYQPGTVFGCNFL